MYGVVGFFHGYAAFFWRASGKWCVTRALLLFQEFDIGTVKYDDRWHRRCLSTRALIVFAHPPTRLARKQINTSITGIITWFEVLDRQREKKKNIAINPSLIIYYILCKVILRINWCIMHILIFLKIIDCSVNWMTCCIHIV